MAPNWSRRFAEASALICRVPLVELSPSLGFLSQDTCFGFGTITESLFLRIIL